MRRTLCGFAIVAAALASVAPAHAAGRASVAALQVALHARGFYRASIDGVAGPHTHEALRRFQGRAGLVVDGVAGPRTRRALGRLGRPRLGARPLRRGQVGWDISALQFLLARHGFPSGTVDGSFGRQTLEAVSRFQRHAGLKVDGIVGPATLAAVRRPLAASPGRSADSIGIRAATIAQRYLGVPYVWAGDDPLEGFDCSGFTAYVYGLLGTRLPHSSSLQWRQGTRIGRADLLRGDLVFFDPGGSGAPPGLPGHVGIYVGSGRFVEAPRTGDVVKISSVTQRARVLTYLGAVRPY